ncbi:hypothetical protein [Hymenobacter volaticus]|uniref:Uncharacterized protein n=1 Tax=Hymenobacter volaticus TaxID=2932254 RepID=A0ABY4G1W1_9BACT|nr:hypothetical protein [Hymenobacter volaticus]UOQ64853.1 hypothetical protein MUN86_14920 [Hymenobacter volaticus]
METPTLFERLFATHEQYYADLEKNIHAVEKIPSFFTVQVTAAIARKIKAEYDAMALYYRESAIPNAQKMVDELIDGYNKSQQKKDYAATFGKRYIFEDSFHAITREVLMSGYIAISHKLEMLIEYTKNHSTGKPYATMQEPVGYHIVDYLEHLNADFGLPIDRLMELDHNVQPKKGIWNYNHLRTIITPRIYKIRMTANRIKHQGGYPKHANDPIFDFYPNFSKYPNFGTDIKKKTTFRIPLTEEELLLDLDYAGKYITQILGIFSEVNMYSIIMSMIWVPAQKDEIQARYTILTHYLPSLKASIKNKVKQVKDVWLDKDLEPSQRIPKPTKFIFDESNL